MPANSEYIPKLKRVVYAPFLFLFVMLAVFLLTVAPGHTDEYVIGEGDLLKIAVYDNPDLTADTRVSGDGKITLPLIGEVTVTGLTAAAAQKVIAEKLADGYIRKPQVTVFITEYRSKKVTTLGEFTKPGLIELRGNSTLMEVISNAGGITVNASDTLIIKRKNPQVGTGTPAEDLSIVVDLNRLLEKGDISTNIMVKDGDSIYVPRAAFIYVTGEVKTPGAYKVTKGLTVLRSITLAGGFTQRAAKNSTSIVRKSDKGEASLPARMEDLVNPDDIIVVPESFF
jgi:polysaccharide export outer membrane protein